MKSTRTLAEETQILVQPHGSPLPPFPETDFTAVKYWAEWCAPCRELDKVLEAVLADYPRLRINVLNVEADTTKGLKIVKDETSGTKQLKKTQANDGIEKIMVDLSQVPPELRSRLMEGRMTEEDRAKLREYAAQQEKKQSSQR